MMSAERTIKEPPPAPPPSPSSTYAEGEGEYVQCVVFSLRLRPPLTAPPPSPSSTSTGDEDARCVSFSPSTTPLIRPARLNFENLFKAKKESEPASVSPVVTAEQAPNAKSSDDAPSRSDTSAAVSCNDQSPTSSISTDPWSPSGSGYVASESTYTAPSTNERPIFSPRRVRVRGKKKRRFNLIPPSSESSPEKRRPRMKGIGAVWKKKKGVKRLVLRTPPSADSTPPARTARVRGAPWRKSGNNGIRPRFILLDPPTPPPAAPAPFFEQIPGLPHSEPTIVRWTQLTPTVRKCSEKPAARHGHKAVVLNKKQVMIFGGGNEELFPGVNIFNVETLQWSQPKVTGDPPPLTASFGAVYDNSSSNPARHRVLVFGGMGANDMFTNDLYELKLNRLLKQWVWRKLNPIPTRDPCLPYPHPRIGHSFTLVNGKIYLFGGLCRVPPYDPVNNLDMIYANDLHVINFQSNYPHGVWDIPVTFGLPPEPRESHSAVVYSPPGSSKGKGNKIYIFGGRTYGRRIADLFELDVDSMFWNSLWRPYEPIGRSLHSASVVGNKMYLFGGWVERVTETKEGKEKVEHMCVNTVKCLDFETMFWDFTVSIGTDILGELQPEPRAGHCAFTVGGSIYIWGGRNEYSISNGRQVCHNDMWRLDVEGTPKPNKPKLLKPAPKSGGVGGGPVAAAGAESNVLPGPSRLVQK